MTSPGVSGRRMSWALRAGGAAAVAVSAPTRVISPTAVRQVMAFFVFFILGTCFVLLVSLLICRGTSSRPRG